MVGGVLSFGLTSLIKPKSLTKIEQTNHQTRSCQIGKHQPIPSIDN